MPGVSPAPVRVAASRAAASFLTVAAACCKKGGCRPEEERTKTAALDQLPSCPRSRAKALSDRDV